MIVVCIMQLRMNQYRAYIFVLLRSSCFTLAPCDLRTPDWIRADLAAQL